jgi:trimethyllysine dioxygenase
VCGAYIGIDEYRSKLAVLKEKFDGADDNSQNKAGRPEDSRSIWNFNL